MSMRIYRMRCLFARRLHCRVLYPAPVRWHMLPFSTPPNRTY
jgi:hypothetical protein